MPRIVEDMTQICKVKNLTTHVPVREQIENIISILIARKKFNKFAKSMASTLSTFVGISDTATRFWGNTLR